MRLGVVIPTLDEAARLPRLLDDLARLPIPIEVVVADGGSTDETPAISVAWGAQLVRARRGRAAQLNAGAAATDAPWLLFLHADVRMPAAARDALVGWIESGSGRAAVFQFALEGRGSYWRVIEFGQRVRQRLLGLCFGDQGLVVAREAFDAVGGYPDLPLMEDAEIALRLRRRHGLATLPAALLSSPRRYEREGRLYGWLRNTALVALYWAGVAPHRLARWYRFARESGPHPPDRTPSAGARELLVFAKAPVAGRVKTRLASAIGASRATAVYRVLGRRVLTQVAGGPYRIVVCYDPPDAAQAVRVWLGGRAGVRLELEPQASGDLGRRLEAGFAAAFGRGAAAVVAVGTDTPGVDRAVVARAFECLQRCDAVVGPALDGGYYLIGLARPAPALFRGVPWSTERVLAVTRERARALRLVVEELDPLADVDTPDDLFRAT